VVEGKPQRPHRRLVALNDRLLELGRFAIAIVMEQIPGWSSPWPHVSEARRHPARVLSLSRVEQPVILAMRCYRISQGTPFLGSRFGAMPGGRTTHSGALHTVSKAIAGSASVSSRIAAIAGTSPTAARAPRACSMSAHNFST
jgi:hypothetical protein